MSTGLQFDQQAAQRLEEAYSAPGVVARRQAVRQSLGLRSGQHVLDIGSGPGIMTYEMAEAVGSAGRVCGIDTSEAMLASARARGIGQAGGAAVEFSLGSATRLPFADAEFDVLAAVQVYEFVADMTAALSEAYRALRPGGRIAILDTDWESVVWHSSDPARMRRILAAWDEHLADPYLPRTLQTRLEAAGLRLERQEVIVQFSYQTADGFCRGLAGTVAGFVAGRQGVTSDEAAAWAADLRHLSDAGSYFFSLNNYLFVATKPA